MEKEKTPTNKSEGLTPAYVTERKIKTLSVSEYTAKYHPGLSNQAIDYAMNKGKIDFVRQGRFRYVCLTKKTADYVPRIAKQRGERIIAETSGI